MKPNESIAWSESENYIPRTAADMDRLMRMATWARVIVWGGLAVLAAYIDYRLFW